MKLNKILSLLGLLLERRCCSCPPTGPGPDGRPLSIYTSLSQRIIGFGEVVTTP